MMITYKAFLPDYSMKYHDTIKYYDLDNWNEEPIAQIHEKGFHSAYDPLDTLTYYSWNGKNRFCAVLIDGIISDDGVGSRVSSTRMKILKELNLEEFLSCALQYAMENPEQIHELFYRDTCSYYPFVLCAGENPVCKGKEGQYLGFLKTGINPEIALYHVGDDGIKSDVFYDINATEITFS